jgi:hypothetical protein
MSDIRTKKTFETATVECLRCESGVGPSEPIEYSNFSAIQTLKNCL